MSSPAMEREEGSISPFADRYPKEFLMVYLEKGSIGLIVKRESGGFQQLEDLLYSNLFNGICFGTFLFLIGCTCGERLSESESQSLSMKS